MDQSPAAFFYKADATDNGERGATGFRRLGDFRVNFLLHTGSRGGGENLLPTCVLCHVSRCKHAVLSCMSSALALPCLPCSRRPLTRGTIARTGPFVSH